MKDAPRSGVARIHIAHIGAYLQCTSYLIEGPDGAILVDPGSGSVESEVIANIEAAGVKLTQVRAILLTHCHVDHALGAYRLQRMGIPIICSPITAGIMRAGGHEVWYEYPEYVIPTEIAKTVEDGEVFELCGLSLRAVHTPGHTPGCASYLVKGPEGLTVFTGDFIGGNGHPTWTGSDGFSTDDTLRSLQKIIEYEPIRGYRGHGKGQFAQPAVDWFKSALKIGLSGQWRLDSARHPDARPPAFFEKAIRRA